MNFDERRPRTRTVIVCVHCGWAGSWSPSGSSAATVPTRRQTRPSNVSSASAFQYEGVCALMRSSSRPSRGQSIGP